MIDVKKSDGTVINVELISYFNLASINKKYLFYTMNEVVENDLKKMYVAEVVDTEGGVTVGQKMTDDEWTNLKGVMKSILTGSRDPNVQYLNIEGA